MKVAIFYDHSAKRLEEQVNAFLSTLHDSQIIDIKFSSSDEYTDALVIYNETKAAE